MCPISATGCARHSSSWLKPLPANKAAAFAAGRSGRLQPDRTFAHRQVDQRTEGAHADTDPPDQGVVAVDVMEHAAEPDAQEAAQLVAEEDDPVERAHVAQAVDMSDQS